MTSVSRGDRRLAVTKRGSNGIGHKAPVRVQFPLNYNYTQYLADEHVVIETEVKKDHDGKEGQMLTITLSDAEVYELVGKLMERLAIRVNGATPEQRLPTPVKVPSSGQVVSVHLPVARQEGSELH